MAEPQLSRPLRIAHVAFSALPATVGGLEIVVDNLMRQQLALGHEATLVTRWKQANALRGADFPYPILALPPNLNLSGRPYGSVGPRWPVAASAAWHQWRHQFDVWHAHWIYPTGWMVQGVLARAQVPLVMTAHGSDVEVDLESGHGYRQFPLHEKRLIETLGRAKSLTAISAAMRDRFTEVGVAPDRIADIPNGVDFDRFQALKVDQVAVRQRFGLPTEGRLIVTVGSNRPAKGHRFIPDILARLGEAAPVHWAVLGGDAAAMAPLAEAADVTGRLTVIPPLRGSGTAFPDDEVIALLRAADVFVLPSVSEGFGMAALEAMAAGVPVVASDLAGLRSFVESGRNGVLVPAKDPGAFAAAIAEVLRDPARAKRLADAGLETARGYDWARIASLYVEVYERAIAGGPI